MNGFSIQQVVRYRFAAAAQLLPPAIVVFSKRVAVFFLIAISPLRRQAGMQVLLAEKAANAPEGPKASPRFLARIFVTAGYLIIGPLAALAADPLSGDKLDSAAQGSRISLKLTHHEPAIRSLELIRTSVARGDYAGVWQLIEQMLAEPDSFVPAGESSEASTREEIRRLLQNMPAEQRQRLNEQRVSVARNAWEHTRYGSMSDVVAFVQQYGDLPTAVDGWWWIASQALDRGQIGHATAAFSRLAEHPRASRRQRAMALAAIVEILSTSDRKSEAQASLRQLLQLDREIAIGIGGRAVSLGKWLDAQPADFPKAKSGETLTPASSASVGRMLPVAVPEWTAEFKVTLRDGIELLEQRQREQGIRPVPIVSPLVVDQRVIVRTLEEIRAFDLESGAPLWKIPNLEFQKIDPTSLAGNVNQTAIATGWAQRRTAADSNFGSMSTDERHLFFIQEPNRQGELLNGRDRQRGILRTGSPSNKLCCYSLETGEPVWETDHLSETDGGEKYQVFFFGGFVLLDNCLYIVAQRGSDVSLAVLDTANGRPIWSLDLGSTTLPINNDLQRSRVACPIVIDGDTLVCSTSAGTVVAIDPILRGLKWAYRFPATTVSEGDLTQPPNQSESALNHEIWWKSWRTPFAAVCKHPDQGVDKTGVDRTNVDNTSGRLNGASGSSPILVFASPENDQLHAIRMTSGERLWSAPRNLGLFVAGIDNGAVVVVEGDFVRAHDLVTGHQLWRTATGEIGGPGICHDSTLVIPLRAGGMILLDIKTGQVVSEPQSADFPLGVLAATAHGWIAYNRQTLMLLPRVEELREYLKRELLRDPSSEPLKVRTARLDLQSGDTKSARDRLEGLQSPPAREIRRQVLIAALARGEVERLGLTRTIVADQLAGLSESAEHKIEAAAATGTSALADNDLLLTVRASLDGLTADSDQPDSQVKRSSAGVRKDRVLLGLIDEAFRRANPGDISRLDELFQSRVREARNSRDKFALQRLSQQWRGLEWGRRLIVSDEDKLLRKRSPVEAEFRLLDAASSNDQTVAVRAMEQLARRFEKSGSQDDARAIRQRILREIPSAKFPDGQTELTRIEADVALRESVFGHPKPAWPENEPWIERRNDRNWQIFSPIIPVHADPGSLCERLDICVHRTGSDIVFRGESFFQCGQDEDAERRFPLPKTQSVYREATGYLLREGWAVGRIVVLQIGSELFAIAPLDEQGEPNSKFQWANPIDLKLPLVESKVVPGRLGQQDEQHVLVDETDRPLARIGPVRAGYLCYQKGTRLVAVDTETGRELWQRFDLPDDATVLGDDQYVFLWRDSNSLEILSVLDGRKLDNGVWFASPKSMIHHRGSLVWTETLADKMKLELHDLRTGQLIWSRSEPADSLVKVIDPETLSIVTGDGKLHLLAARTGSALCEPIAVDSTNAVEIVAWHDPERWYIAVSREVKDLSILKQAPQSYHSYRLKFINGSLYAVDRHAPRLLWSREFKNEAMALDQSSTAPILVQLWNRSSTKNRGGHEAMLRVIDKRTGKSLIEKQSVEILPYWALNPDPQQAIVELKLTRETYRFSYLPEIPADAVEAIRSADNIEVP